MRIADASKSRDYVFEEQTCIVWQATVLNRLHNRDRSYNATWAIPLERWRTVVRSYFPIPSVSTLVTISLVI